jgi:hypothetical protein
MNTVMGPPTNLAITPDQKLAIVANSMDWQKDGDDWKPVPDNKLYVIDLKASPPKHVATVEVGKQPSGLAINGRGDLALVTNRADNSISVLSIMHDEVKLIDTVTIGEQVSHVAITGDGKRAVAAKFPGHKAALLAIMQNGLVLLGVSSYWSQFFTGLVILVSVSLTALSYAGFLLVLRQVLLDIRGDEVALMAHQK